jgi:hypothetical protein
MDNVDMIESNDDRNLRRGWKHVYYILREKNLGNEDATFAEMLEYVDGAEGVRVIKAHNARRQKAWGDRKVFGTDLPMRELAYSSQLAELRYQLIETILRAAYLAESDTADLNDGLSKRAVEFELEFLRDIVLVPHMWDERGMCKP